MPLIVQPRPKLDFGNELRVQDGSFCPEQTRSTSHNKSVDVTLPATRPSGQAQKNRQHSGGGGVNL